MANVLLVDRLSNSPLVICHSPLAIRRLIRYSLFAIRQGRKSMDAIMVTGLGLIGTALSTLSLVPQVLHTWRSRSVADLSASWLAIALLSMLVWISYGSLVAAPAIVWANVLTFLQAGYLFA